jgi:hypothetical protein
MKTNFDNLTPAQKQFLEQVGAVQNFGATLIVMALLSGVLPLIGVQFSLVELLQSHVPFLGWWMGGIGLLFILGAKKRLNEFEAQIRSQQAEQN